MQTAERIVDAAEALMMTRGYNAFSYHDLAPIVGIKTASIHYHFKTKDALVLAVVERYVERIVTLQTQADADSSLDAKDKLELYFSALRAVATAENRICLLGVLGAEINTLADPVRVAVTAFYRGQEKWITKVLSKGRREGTLEFKGPPGPLATMAFAAIEGALIVGRATGQVKTFDDTVKALDRIVSVSS
ncbi:MAG: TetR/AcrR family transcriptional regulator [Deltaproteobacteria bacterium]